LLAACGPGQMFGPAFTPTPTVTATPSPTPTFTATPTATITSTVTPSTTPTSTTTPITTPSTGDTDGKSIETAVVVLAADEFTGVAMEYAWLEEHYPGYQRGAQAAHFEGDKIYDVLSFKTADGTNMEIYFDITAFYGKL
jgi:hypothetical protein